MFKKRDCDRLSLPNFSQDITVTACLQVTVDLPKILICAIYQNDFLPSMSKPRAM